MKTISVSHKRKWRFPKRDACVSCQEIQHPGDNKRIIEKTRNNPRSIITDSSGNTFNVAASNTRKGENMLKTREQQKSQQRRHMLRVLKSGNGLNERTRREQESMYLQHMLRTLSHPVQCILHCKCISRLNQTAPTRRYFQDNSCMSIRISPQVPSCTCLGHN